MNLFDTTQIGLERALAGAALRQATLADNIANANTPGYKRRDVDFHSALRDALTRGGAAAVEATSFAAEADASASMRYDANSVDIDVESATLASNGLEYDALVAVARGRIDVLESAIGAR